MRKHATISEDGVYRYGLSRIWDDRPPLVFVMLNPSTADADIDDPTIRRCIGFAQALGCGGIIVVNLYALRSTDPSALLTHADPVGPQNDLAITNTLKYCGPAYVICAWGAHKTVAKRERHVMQLIESCGFKPHALRITKDGHPSHPLYLPASLRPVPL